MKMNDELIQSMAKWVAENGLIDYGGATLKGFLNIFDIDQKTYYNWLKKSDFSDVIKKAKDEFKSSLEHDIVMSMAKAAKGYEYEQKSTEYTSGKDGKPIIKKQVKKNIYIEPNIGAGIFLLTNIAPDRWSNKQKQELSGTVSTGLKIVVQGKEDVELLEKMKAK